MKKFLNVFFVVLGAIFLVVILFSIYFYVADPMGLKPLLELRNGTNSGVTSGPGSTEGASSGLSAEQSAALQKLGIDPSTIPTSFTPAQEACANSKIGAQRVTEIKNGGMPSISEYSAVKACF